MLSEYWMIYYLFILDISQHIQHWVLKVKNTWQWVEKYLKRPFSLPFSTQYFPYTSEDKSTSLPSFKHRDLAKGWTSLPTALSWWKETSFITTVITMEKGRWISINYENQGSTISPPKAQRNTCKEKDFLS